MYYCAGEYCSKRSECEHNKPDTTGRLQQWLDMSTQGNGYGRIDKNGKYFSRHEYWCGDRADSYTYFEPISEVT